MEELKELQEFLKSVPAEEGLQKVAEMYPGKVKFSSSLGQEDQVLTDMISRHSIDISIFTLDTGRLFNETYELIEKTEARYQKKIEIYFPEADAVEKMVNEKGINLFYNSVEERKLCCHIRKVVPLNRALTGTSVWVTGLRSSQTTNRHDLPIIEWMPEKNLFKYNPLLNKGFVSIGCLPCTRAIEPGEDPRAGRWWWETSQKECGLHVSKVTQPNNFNAN